MGKYTGWKSLVNWVIEEIGSPGAIKEKKQTSFERAVEEIITEKGYYFFSQAENFVFFVIRDREIEMSAEDTEVEKTYGDLRVTLVANRDGILVAFGLNGVKKASVRHLGEAIHWLTLCQRSPMISAQAKYIFKDISRLLSAELGSRL